MIRQFGDGREKERRVLTATTAVSFIPFTAAFILSPLLKVPFGAVEVCTPKWPYVWYVGILSNWRNCLLMLVRIFYRMKVDDRIYLFSNNCWGSSDLNS
jgi:hypothetical protein